jgi:REP element-mobilizing transposase RayT
VAPGPTLLFPVFPFASFTGMSDQDIDDLYAYLGGIVRELRGKALVLGGTRDHVHMLLKLPCDLAVADCLHVVKANSSRWIHEKWPQRRSFAWQVGYGAFSVSESGHSRVVEYIRRQEEHHRKMSFQDEFMLLLRKQGSSLINGTSGARLTPHFRG